MMMNFLKKNGLALVSAGAMVGWLWCLNVFEKDIWLDKFSGGVIGRLIGCWIFPLLLSVLWLKKEIFQKLLAKYAFYVFVLIFGVLGLCFSCLLYFGILRCEWCVSGDWRQAFLFYYCLVLPAWCGVEIVVSLLIAAVSSIVSGGMKEEWFGRLESKKNKILLLVILFLWVTFLPNLIQFSSML